MHFAIYIYMLRKSLKIFLLLLAICLGGGLRAQKLITYEAGMGSRKSDNPDVWILYQKVKAEHEGMWLYADSALLNSKRNDFTAYRRIKIILSDTTTVYGDSMYYDGITRVVNIWADTVVFIDGKTVLKTPRLSYNRNTSTATYFKWGHTTNGPRSMDSRWGYYHTDTEDFEIYENVVLQDTSSRLETDTLFYNMKSHVARFVSPTNIFSDSSHVYSEQGTYNTDTRYATSTKASQVESGSKVLTSDTLYYNENTTYGQGVGHVHIKDTANNVTCTGNYGETNRKSGFSLVTDSALVIYVDKKHIEDSLYMHGDTIYVFNNSSNDLELIRAYYKVKTYRKDFQGLCDSSNYWVKDSLLVMYKDPILWYEQIQFSSDTIEAYHNADGLKMSNLKQNCMLVQQLDTICYNQVKGKNMVVYFKKGDPTYADVLANSQMCYYVTEDDTVANTQYLIGVNVGLSTDMRVYFKDREPCRVVASGNPDMHTYPVKKLPDEWKRLKGFRWESARRPRHFRDVFVW